MSKTVSGFSKLTKIEKIDWLVANFFDDDKKVEHLLKQYWNSNEILQDLHDDFIENTISNFYLPFGIAPNFLINGRDYIEMHERNLKYIINKFITCKINFF